MLSPATTIEGLLSECFETTCAGEYEERERAESNTGLILKSDQRIQAVEEELTRTAEETNEEVLRPRQKLNSSRSGKQRKEAFVAL
jgi:hypothetical protein